MTRATSPFLNKPVRSEEQACSDHARAAREQARLERERRLSDHGAAFCRTILDGTFERIYQPDGSYLLREIRSGIIRDSQSSAVTGGDARARKSPSPSSLDSRPGLEREPADNL